MVSFFSFLARLCCPSPSFSPADNLPPSRPTTRPTGTTTTCHAPLGPSRPIKGIHPPPLTKSASLTRQPSSVYDSYSQMMNEAWGLKNHWDPPPKAKSLYPEVDPRRLRPPTSDSETSSTISQPISRPEPPPSEPTPLPGVAPPKRPRRKDLRYDFGYEFGETPNSSLSRNDRRLLELAQQPERPPQPKQIIPVDHRPCGNKTAKKRALAAKCGHAYRAAPPPAKSSPPPPPPATSNVEAYIAPRSE